MDTIQSVSDADFDSFWEDESKNKNRNRIRVGRQYQAKVPSLLKPGQSDGRNLSELETLHWRPGAIKDDQLDQYLAVARAVGQFSKAVYQGEGQSGTCLQAAFRGLSEFVTSHHPGHRDAGCRASRPAEWSPAEAKLFAQALGACRKNFTVIKKDFLPWGSADSLYYAKKGEDEASTSAIEEPLTEEDDSKTSTGTDLKKEEEEAATEKPIKEETKEEEVVPIKEEVELKTEFKEEEPVVKKEEEPSKVQESAETLGTLQFYFDGQVVLELSAQEKGRTTRWVQMSRTLPGRCKKLSQEHASIFPPVEEPEEPLEPMSDEEGPSTKKAKLASSSSGARKGPAWWSREDSPSEEVSPVKRGPPTPSRPSHSGILSRMLSSPVPAHYLNPGSAKADEFCPLDLSSSRDDTTELSEGQDQGEDWPTTSTPWMPYYMPPPTYSTPSSNTEMPLDLSASTDDQNSCKMPAE